MRFCNEIPLSPPLHNHIIGVITIIIVFTIIMCNIIIILILIIMTIIGFSLFCEFTMQYKVLAPEGKTRSSATKTSRMVTVLNIRFLMTLLNMRMTIRRMMMMRESITLHKMSTWLCLS